MSTVTTQTIRRERQPGGDIPESVMFFVGARPDLFQDYQTHDRDTERIMKMSKRGITKEDAEAIAWLLWRARLVQSWTAVNRVPTIGWEDAVMSGWLKDEMFKLCKAKRDGFYAEREARRNRLDSLVQTGLTDEDIEHAPKEQVADLAKAQHEGGAVEKKLQEIRALS